MSRKYHKLSVCNDTYVIDERYCDLKPIGYGAYGTVVSAFDKTRNQRVAIKKIKDVFSNMIFAKRILREVKLMRHFQGRENVVKLFDIMINKRTDRIKDTYLVLNLMESDLDQIIRSAQPLSDQHIQFFLYQALRALKYVHSANVVHRDLKPSNLLVNSNCDIVLSDFGLSRGVSGNLDENLTEYVVTRWYRAPELLAESQAYGKAVDVWSLGIIFAELLMRRPIFGNSRSPNKQLSKIIEIIGCDSAEKLSFVKNDIIGKLINESRKMKPAGLKQLLPKGINDDAIDLLGKMLVVEPNLRINVYDALVHPYLSNYNISMINVESAKIFDNSFESNDSINSEETIGKMFCDEMSSVSTEEENTFAENI